jgi:pimeloyl-ACP methyl ester carboxylesterase
MNLVYIHGANATSESFNYIRSKLGDGIDINYDSRNGFENNLKDMQAQLQDYNNLFFIAHSLGGIYSLHLANSIPDAVRGAVTLSTPYGGAEVADYAQYFLPFSRLMRDIGPSSWVMKQANRIKIQHPWTNIVTVKGQSAFMHEPNDGVVTIASQKHHKDMELIEVDYNHYEVVLSDEVIGIVKQKYLECKSKKGSSKNLLI